MTDRTKFMQIVKQRILICDGAMGTMLQASGMLPGHCPEEWNLSNPQSVSRIHQNYLEAGADIIETNTFGANRYRLQFQGIQHPVAQINQKAAEIARSVCPEDKFVAGSVGPSGEFLEPIGTIKEDQLGDAFKEQIEALLSGGVDLIIVETMSDINEGLAAIKAARSCDTNIPILSTMTFEKKETGYRTMMGIKPLDMIEPYLVAGADVVGANCGTGMADMLEIVEEIRNDSDVPLLVQANAGFPERENGQLVYKETPQHRAKDVARLLQFNVQIVGGCCGTRPDHIRATAEVIRKAQKKT